mmetsp:Transcript_22976/g.26619  ORF Transcript_22976/g.26619 Transcript_22976/m.26619 type:complete len:112 (-) Transcript_22976:511-846(-)
MELQDKALFDCFLYHPNIDQIPHPTSNFSALVQCSSQSYRSFECKNQIIDTDTNLIEAFPIVRKTSDNVAMKVENTWSSRYLRPYRCIHDNRPEFIGQPIKQMLQRHDCHL